MAPPAPSPLSLTLPSLPVGRIRGIPCKASLPSLIKNDVLSLQPKILGLFPHQVTCQQKERHPTFPSLPPLPPSGKEISLLCQPPPNFSSSLAQRNELDSEAPALKLLLDNNVSNVRGQRLWIPTPPPVSFLGKVLRTLALKPLKSVLKVQCEES